MVDISDRLLVILLVVAVSIAALGTVIGITTHFELQNSGLWLSGAATSTATGETNLTISSSTSLSNRRFTIDFGSGNVNSSCSYCIMDSNASSSSVNPNASGGGCCGTWNYSKSEGFLLENTGNNNLSVGYTCTGNCTFPLFIGGTRLSGMGGLEIKVTSNSNMLQTGESGETDSSASCVGGGASFNQSFGLQGWNISNKSAYSGGGLDGGPGNRSNAGVGEQTYVMLSSVGHWLCGNSTSYPLSSLNTQDAGVVDINVTIPSDAPANGVRSSFTLTFNGTSAS